MSDTAVRSALMDRLRAFVGKQAGPPFVARDPVNGPMIRHWCEAMGDRNSVYTDATAAEGSVHGGIVAPPTMLQAWTMKGLVAPPRDPGDAQAGVIAALDEAGFTSIVATNCEQEYVRYLRPGDVVTATTVVDSVSEEKRTALGPGHFYSTLTTYTDQNGDVVGTQRFRLLKFKPASPAGERPRPAMNDDSAFFWEGVRAGELRIQRCTACGTLRHPPRPGCGACGSLDWDWIVSTGRGTVYSYAIHHYPAVPGFEPPFAVILVELEEGTRLISNLVDAAEPRIGMPVEVRFVNVADELTLPLFAPAE
jgi:uncharacterized OB-fold protein/acyl dehydratase